jgi:sensor histidine kinase YesM
MKSIIARMWIWRMIVAGVLVSLAVPIINWTFDSHMSWHALWIDYVMSLAYAFCIGSTLYPLIGGTWCTLARLHAALQWIIRVILVVIGTAVGCLAAGLIVWSFYGASYSFWPSFVGSFKIGLVLSAFGTTFLSFYETSRKQLQITETQLKTKELERERALKLATEARLASLQSRIHPHFLFNTINSVSALIHDDPQRAERMLNQMADLLRFSLDSAQRGVVPLERELHIVEDYLEIEKARFGDRLRYEIQAPRTVYDAAVPPLALQTLVENSVKYAVNARRNGAAINIRARAAEGKLVLEVHDDGPGFASQQIPSGHGLNNLQERLTALFGGEADLKIVSSEAGATVTIELPLVARIQPNTPLFSAPTAVRV